MNKSGMMFDMAADLLQAGTVKSVEAALTASEQTTLQSEYSVLLNTFREMDRPNFITYINRHFDETTKPVPSKEWYMAALCRLHEVM